MEASVSAMGSAFAEPRSVACVSRPCSVGGRTAGRIALAFVTGALVALSGCTPPLLVRSDQYSYCTIGVSENFGAARPLFRLPIGAPLGPVETIAMIAADVGLRAAFVFPPAALAALPALALALAEHQGVRDSAPPAEGFVADADVHYLARAVSATVAATHPDAACRAGAAVASQDGKPDAVVEIDAVDIRLRSSMGTSTLSTVVHWRMVGGADRRQLAAATTTCRFASAVEPDGWLAPSARTRAEIERVLATTGENIAEQLFTYKARWPCESR